MGKQIFKTNKGITLIALIVTIVILLILTVVSIRLVINGGIINRAENAVNEYTLEQEKEIILIAYTAFKMEKYYNPNPTLQVEGASAVGNEVTGWDITFEKSGNIYYLDSEGNISEGAGRIVGLVHKGAIPDGGMYTAADGTVYNAGQNFPATLTIGDVYTFGDYEYKYNFIWVATNWAEANYMNKGIEGWGVRVLDTSKTNYSEIIAQINEKNVVYLTYTFYGCTALTSAPDIPSEVIWMNGTFYNCTALTETPDMSNAVKVSELESTFCGCTALQEANNLPDSVRTMENAFNGCTSLVSIQNIPSSLEDLNYAFSKCESLTTVPAIPSSVKNIGGAFKGCKQLNGNIEINANPIECDDCFRDTERNIIITGSSTKKAEIAATATRGNVTY